MIAIQAFLHFASSFFAVAAGFSLERDRRPFWPLFILSMLISIAAIYAGAA